MATVDIVMSVYNGERYLREMLESLSNQTFEDWRLIVRDNGSTDLTAEILTEFENSNPSRVLVLAARENEARVWLSFGEALRYSDSPYCMFADGDDFWLPEKIESAVQNIQNTERSLQPHVPVLIHTDLIVTNQELMPISESMWKTQRLNPDRKALNQVLMHSNASGNTFILNSFLRELVVPIPEDAIMHDYWISCVASIFGVIQPVDDAQILYRQHGTNTCGSQRMGLRLIADKLGSVDAIKQRIRQKYRLAGVLLDRYQEQLSPEQWTTLKDIAMCENRAYFSRLMCIFRRSLWLNSWFRNIGLLVFC